MVRIEQVEHITSEDVMEYYREHVHNFGARRNCGLGLNGLFDGMRIDSGHYSGARIIFDFDSSANMEIAKLLGQKTIEIGLNKNLDCKRVKPLASLNEDIPVKHSDELKQSLQVFADSQAYAAYNQWVNSLSNVVPLSTSV